MKTFELFSDSHRGKVDLRNYEEMIRQTIKEIMPDAKVTVAKRRFTVDPTPTQCQSIYISKTLSKTECLGEYIEYVPRLFRSV